MSRQPPRSDSGNLPVVWEPAPGFDPAPDWSDRRARLRAWEALLAALSRSVRRGEGPSAWAAPLSDDPLAFILDAIEEAVTVWDAAGNVLYANRAASGLDLSFPGGTCLEVIELRGRRLQRRCVRFRTGGVDLLLEILGPGGP
jgi:hypothetical protein